ncbi:MAG TPA: cytochrome c-type biogenesis protein [Longimicrobiales bacterium]
MTMSRTAALAACALMLARPIGAAEAVARRAPVPAAATAAPVDARPRVAAPAAAWTATAARQEPAAAGGAAAQYDPELEARTSAVASQLRCPVCQGLSIEDSPTDLARDMRAVVREQLAAGRSPDEVKDYFVSKYGEWILLEPEPHGLNLAVYVLPVLALALGAGVIVRSVRRWTHAPAAEASAAEGTDA